MNQVFQILYSTTIFLTLLYSVSLAIPSWESSLALSSGQSGGRTDRLERKTWEKWSELKRKPHDDSGPKTVLETSYGLHTCFFERPEGKVVLNLPDDITAGDLISGTIIVKPAGQNGEEQQANQDRLNLYELEVARQRTRLHERWDRWTIPPRAQEFWIILRNEKGEEVSKTRVKVQPYSSEVASEGPTLGGIRSSAPHFQIPAVEQAGRPIEIVGAFDGDLQNTEIRLQGQPVRILGESPRKAIAYNPRNNIGRTQISIMEGEQSFQCHYRNIGLSLSAPKLALDHGEVTTLTVLVEGLKDLERPVPLELENKSPIVIGMNGGNKQVISLRPEEVVDGSIRATRILTGVGPGDFNIVVGVAKSGFLGECESRQ